MSRRNTSQRPPEPPQDRSDRFRAGRSAPTGSLRREKQALRPPMTGRWRGGGTRLARVDDAGGSSSQTGLSQTLDPTQYQQDYQVYQLPQDQAYHFEEPQPHQYQFDAYQQHQYGDHHEQSDIEQEQPDIEEPHQQDDIEQSQQHDGGGRFQGCRGWCTRSDRTAMQGGLLSSRFYLTLVDMLHAGFGSMLM